MNNEMPTDWYIHSKHIASMRIPAEIKERSKRLYHDEPFTESEVSSLIEFVQSAIELYKENHLHKLVYQGDVSTYTLEVEKYLWLSGGGEIFLAGKGKTRRFFTFLLPIGQSEQNLEFDFPHIKKCVSINSHDMLVFPSVPSYQFKINIENTDTYEFLLFHVIGQDT